MMVSRWWKAKMSGVVVIELSQGYSFPLITVVLTRHTTQPKRNQPHNLTRSPSPKDTSEREAKPAKNVSPKRRRKKLLIRLLSTLLLMRKFRWESWWNSNEYSWSEAEAIIIFLVGVSEHLHKPQASSLCSCSAVTEKFLPVYKCRFSY